MSEENSNLYTSMVPKPIWGAPGMVGHCLPESAFWVMSYQRDNLELFNSFQYLLTLPNNMFTIEASVQRVFHLYRYVLERNNHV